MPCYSPQLAFRIITTDYSMFIRCMKIQYPEAIGKEFSFENMMDAIFTKNLTNENPIHGWRNLTVKSIEPNFRDLGSISASQLFMDFE